MEEKQSKNIEIIVCIIGLTVFSTLLMMYLVCAFYFVRHFYWGTTIDEVAVGGMTTERAEVCLNKKFENYSLTLEERGDKKEEIKGQEIKVAYELAEPIKKLKEKQNAFAWPFQIGHNHYTLEKSFKYDKEVLKSILHTMNCMNNQERPIDAQVVYDKGNYVVREEKVGSTLDGKNFLVTVESAIARGDDVINLDTNACYINVHYTAQSKEILALKDALNEYLKAKVTYKIGEKTEDLTKEEIHKWLRYNKQNLKIDVDEEALKSYVSNLAGRYNTIGNTRNFRTSSGMEIQISGGDYGWAIDEDEECATLKENIEGKQIVVRSPIYIQEGVSYDSVNDIGNTYVEVNLSSQYLWLYVNSKLVTEGSIVSGTADGVHGTPSGVYKVDYKKHNAILRGPGYACPVAYWLPFNGGIGLHDATWRGSFGGDIYLYNGSHGCINCPYGMVETIYYNIEAGTPVVCYY